MPKKKLTYPFIRNIPVPKPKKRKEYYDTVVEGLLIRITSKGTKTFALAYGTEGKRYTIGRYPTIGLADARDIAKKLKAKIALGEDPQAEKIARRNQPKDLTFKGLVTEYIEKYLPTLREKTRSEYKRIIDKELLPVIGNKGLPDITRRDVISLLDNVAISRGKKTMANRIRSRLHSIFEFGISRGIATNNPVSSVPKYPGGETKKERFYSEEEIKKLWDAFDSQDEPARSVFKMLLVTGQRSKETRHMRWENIEDGVWAIPASLSKSKRKHEVPLSPIALDILKERRKLSGKSDFVFESPQKKGAPLNSLKRPKEDVRKLSEVSDFTPHDLRRTAATYMAKLNIDRTVLGKILNHKGLAGDGLITAIYDRHSYMEEKVSALNKWGAHLQKIIKH